MAGKYANCSCGGLKIDNVTLKVNEDTGRLYAAGAVPDIDINVDDIVDAVRKQVPMTTLPDNGHTLLGTEVFDDAIDHINERFDTDEKSLAELDTAVKNVIKGDFIGVKNTTLIELEKSEQGVQINGQGLDGVEQKINKDMAGGYLGINEQGRVHGGFLPFPTETSGGIVTPDEGIELGTNGHIKVTPNSIKYTNEKMPDVTTLKGALDTLALGGGGGVIPTTTVFTSLVDIGYVEPTGEFKPENFATYCSNFPYGAKFVGRSVTDYTLYTKLANFFISALGDIALINGESVVATIENLSPANGIGAIKYTLINGSQTTSPVVVEEYTHIAENGYNSRWEKTYSDDRTVCYYTAAQMADKLTWASLRDVGQTIISYDDGNVYQLKHTAGTGAGTYSWEPKTISLPLNGTQYYGTTDTLEITTGGNHVVFGNVTNLNISATTPVAVHIFGILTNMTLPSTTSTIILHTSGYNGPELTKESLGDLVSLADGSIIGKYQKGCVAL